MHFRHARAHTIALLNRLKSNLVSAAFMSVLVIVFADVSLVLAGLSAEYPRVAVRLWDHDHERAPVRLRRRPGSHVSHREGKES